MEGMARSSDKSITLVLFRGPHFPASHNYAKGYLQNYPSIKVFLHFSLRIHFLHYCFRNVIALFEVTSVAVVEQSVYEMIASGVDIDALTNCAIKAARILGDVSGNAASCAELSIYLMLGLLRKHIGLFNLIPDMPTGETLLGKTVFISGFGNIGVELAKRLRPFGVKIIAAKRSWASHSQDDDDLVDENGCREDIFGFASKADIVGSLLVNIVRGGLLDYEVVAHYLESGHLGGLGLDVAWTKPFDPNNPILKFQIVLITPHVGGVTEHSYRSTAKVVGDVALQLHAGTPLRGIEPVN
ncbi:D-isomer specific 2-hydroxyacid dehydrogenase family protein [Citrus sinensis]|nr:D-isomer specific 2-hydroxyacid dehydrogenase family protein [Citrus sinensis]